eukprot:SAG11_NODE_4055_length_2084_cov_4.117884_1_plen_636_part_10
MAAATGRVRIRTAGGGTALSPPFDLDRGGIQGGMSTPWTFILAVTEVLFEDSSRRHDLDYAIRRACLRLEIADRRGSSDDIADLAAEDGGVDDPGQIRWNSAVERGARALYGARKEQQNKIETYDTEIASRSMRPSRWLENHADEAALQTAGSSSEREETSGRQGAATLQSHLLRSAQDRGGLDDLVERIRAERNQQNHLSRRTAKRQDNRPKPLHLVRIPSGVVDRCRVCAAAVATTTHFCVECTRLGLDVPLETHWQRLQREAQPEDTSGADSSNEDDQQPPEATRAGPALRSKRRAQPRVPSQRSATGLHGRSRLLSGDRVDYVDDTAVLEAEEDLEVAMTVAGERISNIAAIARERANLHMAPKQCKGLLIQPAQAVGETTAEDVVALGLTDQCRCGEPFASVWGLRVHKRTCAAAKEEFEVDDDGDDVHDIDDLLDVRGSPQKRFWRVKYAGTTDTGEDRWPDKGPGDGTSDYYWVAEVDLSPECAELQNRFWRVSGLDRRGNHPGPDEELRCCDCNQFFANAAALKRHRAKPTKRNRKLVCRSRPKLRRYRGTKVDRRVQRVKRRALLKDVEKVLLEGTELKYELSSELLGHMFRGDGDCDVDVNRRTAIARTTFNKLDYLWRSKKLSDD